MHEVGGKVMEIYNGDEEDFNTLYKSDLSPVTEADLTANELICNYLLSNYPDFPIISEENEIPAFATRKDWDFFWLLDPIDGTKEFVNKTGEFSINLALIHRNQPVFGIIYLPYYEEFYFGLLGEGAYQYRSSQVHKSIHTDTFATLSETINKLYQQPQPIHLSHHKRLFANKFSLSQPYLSVVTSRRQIDPLTATYIDRLHQPRKLALGSALKFISIAKGEADYYPRMINIMEWDTAAGQIIIQESGGALLDAHTMKPLVYNKASLYNPYFIAQGHLTDL